MLPDAGSIQESEVAALNRRNAARGRADGHADLHPGDAIAALDAFRPVDYETWVQVMPGVRARYWNAGHLLGSASIEIEFAGEGASGKPLRVLVSGDIGPDAKLLQPDPEAPTGLRLCDLRIDLWRRGSPAGDARIAPPSISPPRCARRTPPAVRCSFRPSRSSARRN